MCFVYFPHLCAVFSLLIVFLEAFKIRVFDFNEVQFIFFFWCLCFQCTLLVLNYMHIPEYIHSRNSTKVLESFLTNEI